MLHHLIISCKCTWSEGIKAYADCSSGMDVRVVCYWLCHASVALKYFLCTEHHSHAVLTLALSLNINTLQLFIIIYNHPVKKIMTITRYSNIIIQKKNHLSKYITSCTISLKQVTVVRGMSPYIYTSLHWCTHWILHVCWFNCSRKDSVNEHCISI